MAYQPHRRVARPPGNVVPRFGDSQLFPVAVRIRHLRKHGSVFRKAKSAFPFVESVTAGSRFVIAQWALPPGRGGSARWLVVRTWVRLQRGDILVRLVCCFLRGSWCGQEMPGARSAQKLKRAAKIMIFLRNIAFSKKMYASGSEAATGSRGAEVTEAGEFDRPKANSSGPETEQLHSAGEAVSVCGTYWIHWLYAVGCGELRVKIVSESA